MFYQAGYSKGEEPWNAKLREFTCPGCGRKQTFNEKLLKFGREDHCPLPFDGGCGKHYLVTMENTIPCEKPVEKVKTIADWFMEINAALKSKQKLKIQNTLLEAAAKAPDDVFYSRNFKKLHRTLNEMIT